MHLDPLGSVPLRLRPRLRRRLRRRLGRRQRGGGEGQQLAEFSAAAAARLAFEVTRASFHHATNGR